MGKAPLVNRAEFFYTFDGTGVRTVQREPGSPALSPELYEVVAEILVFVDAVDHRMVKENVADGGKHKN